MNVDLNDVVVLVRVVETGSFSAAARRLGVPKSTVSRRISRLEKELGVRLLQRTTRKLNLTDAGKLYYQRCSKVLTDLDEVQRTIGNMQSEPRGTLRLSAPNDMAQPFVAGLIADYCARYPDVRVVVEISTRFVDLVAEGFDLALRAGSLQDSSLVARRLSKFQARLYASPEYLARAGVPQSPEALRKHRCLLLGAERNAAVWQLSGPDGVSRVEVVGAVTSNDVLLLRGAAVAGMGIVNLPILTCADEEQSGRLVRVLPEYGGTESGLYAVYPTGQQLSPKVRRFIELAVEHAARGLSSDTAEASKATRAPRRRP